MKRLLPMVLLGFAPLLWAEDAFPFRSAGGAGGLDAESLRRDVLWLADPERAGRMAGTPGAEKTERWLEDRFRRAGLAPFNGNYRFPFEIDAGHTLVPGANTLAFTVPSISGSGKNAAAPWQTVEAAETAFFPLVFSENGVAEGEVVFAGHGLSVPGGGDFGRYNSYEDLDVTGRIVLLLREEFPAGVDPRRRAVMARYGGLRYRAMMARERGAKAVLFAGEVPALDGHALPGGSGVIAADISEKIADRLLASAGKTLGALRAALADGKQPPLGGFSPRGVRVRLSTAVQHAKKSDYNVIATVPPNGIDEYLVVGAHYDHLGTGKTPGSLARSGEEGQLHPGADDNASGTAVLIELAAELARETARGTDDPGSPSFGRQGKARRGFIFACWGGEEIGLVGSAAFVDHPPVEIGKIAACINFDMVGRLRSNTLSLEGVNTSDVWHNLIEKHNAVAGFKLVRRDDPYLPTDTTSFLPRRIPALSFFTGIHEDYHRPTDTPDKLDYAGAERIARFAGAILLDLVSMPERPRFTRAIKSAGAPWFREIVHPFLGILFDPGTVLPRISGVRIGSPAEQAGVLGGDVLKQLAGREIENVRDYSTALDALPVGKPVKLRLKRGLNAQIEVTVTPVARE